ncbi:MAG: enoyl-CoA hydratase-related protein [Peptoniphilaceae bacterium]|nr:enoyl-CoA hydratase-related protein [Peptoniphilaceae bacterium]MDY6019739.1 enoyl-CoA hydratase-related protein [Anaerococcus sp.]
MDFKNVILEKNDGIALVKMNRPKALNALNSETLDELSLVFDDINKDSEIYVVIITGEGRSFVAGADITEMANLNAMEAKNFMNKGLTVFRNIERCTKPVIAAINGFALGGGCELALSCDIRIASEKAMFGQPEVGLGIIPGFGGTQRLQRIIGQGHAKYLIYTAQNIKADKALEYGLVEEVVAADSLMDRAYEIAKKIMANAPIAVRNAKEAINTGAQVDMDSAIKIEEYLCGLLFATEDQKEGMQAFVNKTKAEFRNK